MAAYKLDVELEHAIGFSGGIAKALHTLPSDLFLSLTGPNAVINSLVDPHDQQFLRGHSDNISVAQVSPTGRLLATGQRGNADILVWDLERKRLIHKFEEHDGLVAALAFSDDERVLLSAGTEDGLIIAWDLSTGMIIGRRTQDPAPLLAIASGGFVKDIKNRDTGIYQFAIAGSKGAGILGLNPLDGRMEIDKFPVPQRDYLTITFAPLPNFPWVYIGSASGDLSIGVTRSRAVQTNFFAGSGGVTSIAAVPGEGDSIQLIIGTGDGTVQVYQHAASSLEHEMMLASATAGRSAGASISLKRSITLSGSIWSIAPLQGGGSWGPAAFLVGTSHGGVYQVTPTLTHAADPAGRGGAEKPSGLSAALLRQGHGASVDPLSTAVTALHALVGTTTAPESGPSKVKSGSAASLITGLPAPLLASARVPDVLVASFAHGVSDRFVTCGSDGFVRVWDAADFQCVSSITCRGAGYPTCVAYANDFLISGWQDGTIRAYLTDAPPHTASRSIGEDSRLIWALPDAHPAREGGITALIISHNQRFFVSGGASGAIRVWDIRTRELVCHFKEHNGPITELVLLGDDIHLYSVSRDRSLLSWDLRTERRESLHTQRLGGIHCVDVTSDGKLVITAGQDKNITYWDLKQTAPVRVVPYPVIAGVEGEALCVCMSHSKPMFVTGGTDGVVRFWDVATGKQISECIGHAGPVRDVQFSPDDKQVVSCGSDGAILVWNVY